MLRKFQNPVTTRIFSSVSPDQQCTINRCIRTASEALDDCWFFWALWALFGLLLGLPPLEDEPLTINTLRCCTKKKNKKKRQLNNFRNDKLSFRFQSEPVNVRNIDISRRKKENAIKLFDWRRIWLDESRTITQNRERRAVVSFLLNFTTILFSTV